jgi:hypothetical protein
MSMKAKGKSAWLITWEGSESEFNGRCKVVAVLPPRLGEKNIISLLPALFCSEYNFTLCEKMSFCIPNKKDPFFKQPYRDINPEFLYGHPPKAHLCARKVKNLRCEESNKDCFESTLYWTELPKFRPNPDFDPNGPMPANLADLTKQVHGEIEVEYTYSNRSNIEEEKRRQAGQIRTGNFSIKLRA